MKRAGILIAAVVLLAACLWLLWGDNQGGSMPAHEASSVEEEGASQPVLKGRTTPEAEEEKPDTVEAPVVDQRGDLVLALGRIVDTQRRPVPGAEIVATVQGVETGRVRADETGAFSVPLVPRPGEAVSGRLEVRAGKLGASRMVFVTPDSVSRIDYGPIPISELHTLSVRVLRGDTPVAGAEVVVGDALAGRSRAALMEGRTDAHGIAHFPGLTAVKVGVYATAPDAGRGYREVTLPSKPVVDLTLPANRTATIHVVKHGTKEPVAGAEVHLAGGGTLPFPRGTDCLPPLPAIQTDENGRAVVSGLPQGVIWVVARSPGLAMRNMGMQPERVFLKANDHEATVTLHPYRAVRFPIKETGAGPPADGVVVEVRRYQPLTGYDVGAPKGRIENGHLILEPFPPGHDWGHVVTPGGTWASWMAPLDKDVGEAIEFRKVYDIRVKLMWQDGTPAEGEILWENLRPRGRGTHVRTDSDGAATFPQCVGESASIMWTSAEHGFGMPVAAVNLLADPGVTEITIDRPVDVVIGIHVGGEARIPTKYEVRVPDLDPTRPAGATRTLHREIREDAASGEIRFRWMPMPGGDAPPVTIRADGMPPVTAVPTKSVDGVWRAVVNLQPSTTLRVRVTPPEGKRYRLIVERWLEEEQRWLYLHNDPVYLAGRRASEGVHVFTGFLPGRYRLHERMSGIMSAPFDLVSGGANLDMEFDLAASVVVRGRVVVPAGEDAGYATVRIAGRKSGTASRWNPIRVKSDGGFEFRARRGERHALIVEHPLLVPKEKMREVVVGQDGPTFHLVPGPQVRFRIEGSDLTTHDPSPNSSPAWWSPVRVRMAPKGEWRTDAPAFLTIARKGGFRVGVPEPGTWVLRVEQPGFVPHVFEDLEVGAEALDLGAITLGRGASLDVRLIKGKASLPQGLRVQATRKGAMPYTATGSLMESGEPPFVRVRGLGPGEFHVVVTRRFGGGKPFLETDVQSDGSTAIAIDLRLP